MTWHAIAKTKTRRCKERPRHEWLEYDEPFLHLDEARRRHDVGKLEMAQRKCPDGEFELLVKPVNGREPFIPFWAAESEMRQDDINSAIAYRDLRRAGLADESRSEG